MWINKILTKLRDLPCLSLPSAHLFICLCSLIPPCNSGVSLTAPPPSCSHTHMHTQALIATWRSVKLQPHRHCCEKIAVCSGCYLLSSHPSSFLLLSSQIFLSTLSLLRLSAVVSHIQMFCLCFNHCMSCLFSGHHSPANLSSWVTRPIPPFISFALILFHHYFSFPSPGLLCWQLLLLILQTVLP